MDLRPSCLTRFWTLSAPIPSTPAISTDVVSAKGTLAKTLDSAE